MHRSRRRATVVAASCLVAPLVALVSDGGVTVFFPFGYVAPGAGFVDVLRYTTELTRGTFWAGYRFWHLAGLAALGATAAAAVGRRGAATALLAAGGVAVLRFWWALASHSGDATLVPVGAAWFVGAAALLAIDGDGPAGRGSAEDRVDGEEQDT